jgi:GNAT superfamily N-acetyltransferase
MLDICTMSESHLEDAATLVARRYRALRATLPLLPARYESAEPIAAMLRDVVANNEGVVAVCGGRLVGFLNGFALNAFMNRQAAYSPDWANGAELDQSGRIYQDLYAQLARRWVADGRVLHAVGVLAHDRKGIEQWRWSGFGHINMDCVRGLEPLPGDAPGAVVRLAGAADAAAVAALSHALEDHIAAPPIFFLHKLKQDKAWLDQPGNLAWLAFEDEQPVGYLALEPGDQAECQLLQDPGTVNICGAFVRPESRGRGLATALMNHALTWAAVGGYARCAVDFETTNPLAARYWPRWFQPVTCSLLRWVDERAAPLPQQGGS